MLKCSKSLPKSPQDPSLSLQTGQDRDQMADSPASGSEGCLHQVDRGYLLYCTWGWTSHKAVTNHDVTQADKQQWEFLQVSLE